MRDMPLDLDTLGTTTAIAMTDDPRLCGGPLLPQVAWTRHEAAGLPGPDRLLWRALGGGQEVHLSRQAPGGWRRLILLSEAPASQFDVLRQAPDLATPAAPVACLALRGRGFHGHRERSWATLPGNLHLSLALVPRGPVSRLAAGLLALPALAVLDALDGLGAGGPELGIKWVNDILLRGRKVAGVLTATQSLRGQVELAILGIGVNAAARPRIRPTPFVPAVGSLAEDAGGAGSDLARLLPGILSAIAGRKAQLLAAGPGPLLEAYRRRCIVLGRRVCIWEEGVGEGLPVASWPPPLARGIVTGIGDDLSLSIAGHTEPITRGRLALLEQCGPWAEA
jgi:biotin-(acetyl-CoA carboxylase) ligase